QQITEVKASADREIVSLRAEISELREFITSQLKKLDNPKTKPIKPGDRILDGGWILRHADVLTSASDQSKFDFATLLETVFGAGYFRKFKTVAKLPPNEKNACNIIIGKLSKYQFQLL